MDQKQYVPVWNSAFYDKGCCTRINEMMPGEPYGATKAFKTFTKSLYHTNTDITDIKV